MCILQELQEFEAIRALKNKGERRYFHSASKHFGAVSRKRNVLVKNKTKNNRKNIFHIETRISNEGERDPFSTDCNFGNEKK